MPTLRPKQAAEVMQMYIDMAQQSNTYAFVSDVEGKINAVNHVNVKDSDWDILLIASDDMIPQVKGWDKRIVEDMQKHFPDLDGVLWYNDGYVGERLNTLPCMGRKYFERFGYVYNPEYKSLWADNEFMEVANHLGKQAYIPDVIIKHEHPGNNPAVVYDEHYKKNDRHWVEDRATYDRRKNMNFGL